MIKLYNTSCFKSNLILGPLEDKWNVLMIWNLTWEIYKQAKFISLRWIPKAVWCLQSHLACERSRGRPCVRVFGKGIIFLTWLREVQTHGTNRKYCTISVEIKKITFRLQKTVSGGKWIDLQVVLIVDKFYRPCVCLIGL